MSVRAPRKQRLASRLPGFVLNALRHRNPHSSTWAQGDYLRFYRRDYKSKPGRWRNP